MSSITLHSAICPCLLHTPVALGCSWGLELGLFWSEGQCPYYLLHLVLPLPTPLLLIMQDSGQMTLSVHSKLLCLPWLQLLSLSRNSPPSPFPLPTSQNYGIDRVIYLLIISQLEGNVEEFHWLPNTQNLEQGWRPRRHSTDRCCWEHGCSSFIERFL